MTIAHDYDSDCDDRHVLLIHEWLVACGEHEHTCKDITAIATRNHRASNPTSGPAEHSGAYRRLLHW